MKKILIIFSFTVFFGSYAQAQSNKIVQNTIYADIVGYSYFYGVGYDRLYTHQDSPNSFGFAVSVGGGKLGDITAYTLPLKGFYCYGKGNSKLEAGTSVIVKVLDQNMYVGGSSNKRGNAQLNTPLPDGGESINLSPYIGYRYQRAKGGLFLRVYASPLNIPVYSAPLQKPTYGLTTYGFSVGYTIKPKAVR